MYTIFNILNNVDSVVSSSSNGSKRKLRLCKFLNANSNSIKVHNSLSTERFKFEYLGGPFSKFVGEPEMSEMQVEVIMHVLLFPCECYMIHI